MLATSAPPFLLPCAGSRIITGFAAVLVAVPPIRWKSRRKGRAGFHRREPRRLRSLSASLSDPIDMFIPPDLVDHFEGSPFFFFFFFFFFFLSFFCISFVLGCCPLRLSLRARPTNPKPNKPSGLETRTDEVRKATFGSHRGAPPAALRVGDAYVDRSDYRVDTGGHRGGVSVRRNRGANLRVDERPRDFGSADDGMVGVAAAQGYYNDY